MTIDLSTVLGLLSLGAAVLTAGRVVFVVEDRVAGHKERLDRLDKFAEEFNGPARAKHVELEGRVRAIEAGMAKVATVERVDALGQRVDQGIAEIKAMLARIEKDMEA